MTPGILGPDYFREVAAILDAAAGGPPDLAALGEVGAGTGLPLHPEVIVPIIVGEPILRREKRDISILVASEEVTTTQAQYAAGEQVAAPHVHHEHTDAFYVLEGELTFEIGREAKTITISSGGFVAAPPGVATRSATTATAPRAGSPSTHATGAAFMRGIRDGVEVEWDISAVPADGGMPASEAIVRS